MQGGTARLSGRCYWMVLRMVKVPDPPGNSAATLLVKTVLAGALSDTVPSVAVALTWFVLAAQLLGATVPSSVTRA